MPTSRRDFLTIAAAGSALATLATSAAAQDASPAATINPTLKVPADQRLRLISYVRQPGNVTAVGAVTADGHVIDLTDIAKSMTDLISAGPSALAAVRKRVAAPAPASSPLVAQVRLLPPIPDIRRNIYAVGWNYLAHFQEAADLHANQDLPEHPVFFSKATGTLNGPFDPIPYDPAVSTMIDWECELAIIIGKTARNVTEADALNYVFGYTVINDTTARDLQQKKHGGQWFKGKSLDGHGPMGPWIVPADQLDYDNLHLLTRINGVVKQDASTKQMYFKVPRIISELSQGLTLKPGDIIATGTPPGVGHSRKPPEFMKPGDVMETEIVEIGTIRNVIGVV